MKVALALTEMALPNAATAATASPPLAHFGQIIEYIQSQWLRLQHTFQRLSCEVLVADRCELALQIGSISQRTRIRQTKTHRSLIPPSLRTHRLSDLPSLLAARQKTLPGLMFTLHSTLQSIMCSRTIASTPTLVPCTSDTSIASHICSTSSSQTPQTKTGQSFYGASQTLGAEPTRPAS